MKQEVTVAEEMVFAYLLLFRKNIASTISFILIMSTLNTIFGGEQNNVALSST